MKAQYKRRRIKSDSSNESITLWILFLSLTFQCTVYQHQQTKSQSTNPQHQVSTSYIYIFEKRYEYFSKASLSLTQAKAFFKKATENLITNKSITSSTSKTKNIRKRSKRIAFLPVHKLCCSTRTILIKTGFPCTLSGGHAGGISH